METQNVLFRRSSEIPEGLYLELMNSLKIDFENNQRPIKVIIVDEDTQILVKLFRLCKRFQLTIIIIFMISLNTSIYCFLNIITLIYK